MDKLTWLVAVVVVGLLGFITIEAKDERIKSLQHELEQYKFTAQVLQKQCQ